MIPFPAFGSLFAKRPERASGGLLVQAARLSSNTPRGVWYGSRGSQPDYSDQDHRSRLVSSPDSAPETARSDADSAADILPRHSPAGPASPQFESPSVYCRSCDRPIPDPICIATDDGHVVSGLCPVCGIASWRTIQPLNSVVLSPSHSRFPSSQASAITAAPLSVQISGAAFSSVSDAPKDWFDALGLAIMCALSGSIAAYLGYLLLQFAPHLF
ncbi:hypothetical protein [Rhodoblastus sp.]|uniref:hypothetical protein n=1 Tax=Rhodoblastus sp. TaxID=1962975 RepID=UPI003F9906B1